MMENNKDIKKDIVILSLETSCDETASAIVKNGTELISNVVKSQIDVHKKFGGVVPEIASREHVQYCDKVIDEALEQANYDFDDIDAFAVTYGPGLVGALLTGVSYMKALSYALHKPLIPVNHIHGHVYANYLSKTKPKLPFVCLIASGGHSHIVIMHKENEYKIIGRTLDDAAGEAFDKAARVLGLSYPGGPNLSRLAIGGNKDALLLPTPKLNNKYDFSFSGLKTAFINSCHKLSQNGQDIPLKDYAASFESKITDILAEKTIEAAIDYEIPNVCIAGGVSANTVLRETMSELCAKHNLKFYMPQLEFCTDNAAMIASAGYFTYKNGIVADLKLNAIPNLQI